MLFICILVLINLIRISIWRFGSEQVPDQGDIGSTIAISKESVVADAVLALWQHMDQEPADELSSLQCHCGVATRSLETVIFDAEGDATLIHADQAAI